ncbi:Protein FAM3C [Oryzias melastigma]|uniref:Protein FAM3C n=1 Tax=Oryzias melastigma TaxID=30732 RepID=A0A834CCK6_ORYME|nr:Protein FAM3C [Oryzias melastigma]
MMKCQAVLHLTAVILVLLVAWEFVKTSFDVQTFQWTKVKSILNTEEEIRAEIKSAPKCSLSRDCPPDRFALSVRSGAGDIVGPRICFNGKTIMNNVLNNVGEGLNIVVVDGERGVVEKYGFLNMDIGNRDDILAYLKEIQPGRIVLVASFQDVATLLTDEIKEIFVGMGSSFITSLKLKDNWVFVGRAGTKIKSVFEKQAVNDEKTNAFEKWPNMVEVAGCFPRSLNATL